MTNEKEELTFLESQLEWIKQRDELLEQIENKLYKMKQIAEKVAANGDFITVNEKHQLNERFLQLKSEIAELERGLQIYYN
ncbi:hypothetical protein [Solibacillus isronensis]|uniref:hypothetical protein n=1 Tax=Solibacillus isronensis TaxID=412383 RepID=UPI00203A46D2|nr:hypothetical protein [Solibacillus isronensis]MCM3722469.1 hypothetical protein [Solibacillus isronensis]